MQFHVRWAQMRPLFLLLGLALISVAGSAGARWN